ncbi:hypothetical protein EDC04DRAFT_2597736 [Pisolithus marmoratus]|nr:hypothetical protein EDC04DRAFT_2597736 [Pisolithus marmoratus]
MVATCSCTIGVLVNKGATAGYGSTLAVDVPGVSIVVYEFPDPPKPRMGTCIVLHLFCFHQGVEVLLSEVSQYILSADYFAGKTPATLDISIGCYVLDVVDFGKMACQTVAHSPKFQCGNGLPLVIARAPKDTQFHDGEGGWGAVQSSGRGSVPMFIAVSLAKFGKMGGGSRPVSACSDGRAMYGSGSRHSSVSQKSSEIDRVRVPVFRNPYRHTNLDGVINRRGVGVVWR